MSFFNTQSGPMTTDSFKRASAQFISSSTLATLKSGTDALAGNGSQRPSQPLSPEAEHLQNLYANTKAAVEIGSDLFFFAGTPLSAGTINTSLEALNVAKDIALFFTPNVNILATGADMLGSIKSLLGMASAKETLHKFCDRGLIG